MHMLEPTINVVMFFDEAPGTEAMAAAFEEHLWPSHRFHSCLGDGGFWVARHSQMDRAYHFREQQVPDEAAIDAFVQGAMLQALDREHPPWTVTALRAPPPSRSAVLFRIHHAVGDGLGLLFAFAPTMGCEGGDPLAKVPLPSALLPRSARRRSPGGRPASRCGLRGVLSGLRLLLRGALLPLTARPDSELCLNAPLAERTPFLPFNGRRAYTRFPPVSMAGVKAVSQRHGCSVNDAMLAALTGALRRYGLEVHKDGRLEAGAGSLEFKTMLMMGLPRPLDESNLAASLCNNILFASCPLPIDEPTALGRLQRVAAACNNLKSRAYMTGLVGIQNFLKGVAPDGVLKKAASETFCKHTLLVSSVPAPTVPITWPKGDGGRVFREVQMVFPNAITQVSIISYDGGVHANIVADGGLFPEPAALGRFWASEFGALAEA
mmetsp:Transcript_65607/g.203263  ORF Transcript_65607/g.203263 Transcript_65607/m.203263 type:complete len:436 (+) Transcript_65607:3-1310(+)